MQVVTITFNLKFIQFCVRTFLSPATSSSQWVWDLRTCYTVERIYDRNDISNFQDFCEEFLVPDPSKDDCGFQIRFDTNDQEIKWTHFRTTILFASFAYFSGKILVEINPEGIKLNIIKITTFLSIQSLQTECEKQKVNILEKWTQFYWYTSIIRLHYCIFNW